MALQGWNNATSVGAYGPWGTGLSGTLGTGLPSGGSTSGAGGAGGSTSGSGGVLPPSAMVSNGSGSGGGSLAPPGSYSAGNGSQAAAMTMADGGVIPPQGDTVTPDLDNALATVQSSLAAGRQQFGLPSQLMGGNQPSSAESGDDSDTDGDTQQSDQQSFETGGEPQAGAIPGAANPDEGLLQASQAQREAIQRAQLSAKEGQGQSVLYPGGGYARGGKVKAKKKVKSFDDGGNMDDPSGAQLAAPSFDDGGDTGSQSGAIPTGGDMDDPSSQGMPAQPQANMPLPQQGQTQPANDPMQALKMYSMGAGAVPPEMAAALEQKVDPTGAMDPSQRKLLAVASAPDPKTQFGMMQHYRQRFNALTAFARAAGTGTQGRPPDISASTQAATRAFHNVPNGHSISFSPAGANHVAVSIAQYADGKGDKGGAGKKGKGYAAGGPVPDDTPDPADSGPEAMSGMPPDIGGAIGGALASGAQGAQDVEANSDQAMTQPIQDDGSFAQGMQQAEGAIPSGNPVLGAVRAAGKAYRSATEGGEKIKQSVMSIPQYLSTLKNSLYDAFMDTPPDSALSDAANKSWANSINAPGMENSNTKEAGEPLVQSDPTSGMTIGAAPGVPNNPVANATSPVQAGSPSLPPGAPAATASGPVTIGGKQFSSPQAARDYWLDKVNENTQNMPAYNVNGKTPDQQAAQLQENYEAAMNAVSATIPGGEHPVQATIPGYDPRILAQANSMYLPSSPAWKDFVTRTQAAYVQSMNARSMQQLKNQGMKDLWGTKENAINGRAAAAIGGHQAVANTNAGARIQAAQIRAAQMAWSSGNTSVSGVAKTVMAQVPGTLPKDAYQQAIAAMPQAGAIVQGGPQPQQPQQQQQQQPITGPIAVNPQTGQRMTVRNGAWVPLP